MSTPMYLALAMASSACPYNSAPDNICTAVNYGSGSSKYGLIVKTASTEYGRFLVGTV